MVFVPIHGWSLHPMLIVNHTFCPYQLKIRIEVAMVEARADMINTNLDHGLQILRFWQVFLVKLRKGEWSETKRLSDVSVFKGVTTTRRVINSKVSAKEIFPTDSVLLDDHVTDLSITVKCDVDDGSSN
ncbi:hypothetical protein LguiA_034070 [Lonicera macranthoides]